MSKKFQPKFTFTRVISSSLARIEEFKGAIDELPINVSVLEGLKKSSILASAHYSTKIEGNRLTMYQVEQVLFGSKKIPNRKRDEDEVKGYYAAFDFMEGYSASGRAITERTIQKLHALVMSKGRTNVKPSEYRDGQNVIRDGASGKIVYLPPESKDVPDLMKALVYWIRNSDLPAPLVAGIAHYQFATIHPYYDGNGRVARLLATMILRLYGYGLKGIYSLDEYYAINLPAYYGALNVGPSHNYYMGREDSDITQWVEYFCNGLAQSFEKVVNQAKVQKFSGKTDQSKLLRKLDSRQRKVFDLFKDYKTVTSSQIGKHLGIHPRTSRKICQQWVRDKFIVVVDPSFKGRKYQLSPEYESLLDS